jgi:hypothetical protein
MTSSVSVFLFFFFAYLGWALVFLVILIKHSIRVSPPTGNLGEDGLSLKAQIRVCLRFVPITPSVYSFCYLDYLLLLSLDPFNNFSSFLISVHMKAIYYFCSSAFHRLIFSLTYLSFSFVF